MLYPARSILAIDISSFGQSLSLLPVMRALRTSYPKTFLVAAAPSGTCELLSACGLVDDTISLGVVKLPDRGNAGALKRLVGLVRRSRRYTFDLVLDFSPRLETQIVSRLVLRARVFTPSKLPRSIGMLLELGGASRSAGRSTHSDYANVLQQAGVEMNDARLAIAPPVEEDVRFENRLASSGSRGGELIVLLYASNPESRHGWPVDAFGEIGTRLANNFNARIIAGDEPSDHAFTRAVSAWLPPGAIKLAEPRAIELLAAIARASIVITDEPAIARIASELSTPVIEIADTISTAAASSTTHRIAQGSSRRNVSTDEVYEIAGEMIQENRSPSLFQRP
jgi:ADP-heptose:LPS heptosyltransferase